MGSGERTIGELEAKPEVHELPADTPKKEQPSEQRLTIVRESETPEERRETGASEEVAPVETAETADENMESFRNSGDD